MRKFSILMFMMLAIAIVLVMGNTYRDVLAQAQKAGTGFAAIPGTKGGQDIFGPYEVVPGWLKDISTVAGNEKWTYGAGLSVYAENPNRVFMLYLGELTNIKRPHTMLLSDLGSSILFTIVSVQYR